MDRRNFLSGAATIPLSSAAIGQTLQESTPSKPPNILFILFDQCRTDAIGAYGERDVQTPNIDFLAETGVRFNNCYTPQALCTPARASIITGSYPHAHGLKRNVYPMKSGISRTTYEEPIPDPFRDIRFNLWDNFPFFLSNAGYTTGHIGKWHLGPANPGFFDYCKSYNSSLLDWIGEPHKSAYRPDVHTGLGVKFIEQHANDPFFLYQSFYPPHSPNDPPKEYLKHFQGDQHAGYYGSVSNLDMNIGRLIDALKKKNILDETMIILTTEHGQTWIKRKGTRDGKSIAYDESARVPLIIRYPKLFPKGKVWESGVSLVDLFPTILDVAGVAPAVAGGRSGPPPVHGQNLIPDIRSGRDRWSRPIIIQNVAQGQIQNSYYDERAIRTERFKLILRKFEIEPFFRPGELYDMKADPAESLDIYESPAHRATVQELALLLKKWGIETGDELAVELGDLAIKN